MKAFAISCIVCVFFLSALCSVMRADDTQFLTNVGLYGGMLQENNITFAQNSLDVMYVSVYGQSSLYMMLSGADVWAHSNDTSGAKGVVVTGDDSVYVLNDNGLEKSSDGGLTWTTLTIASNIGIPYTMAKGPSDSLTVVVEADWVRSGGIYRSTDGGSTWEFLTTLSSVSDTATGCAVSSDGNWFYLCRDTKLFKMQLTGVPPYTLNEVNLGVSGLTTNYISADPAAPDTIYVVSSKSGDSNYSAAGHQMRSINGGTDWTEITHKVGGVSQTTGPVIIDSANPAIIYCGRYTSASRGNDGTWVDLANLFTVNRILFIDPDDHTTLYASSATCAMLGTQNADGSYTWSDLSDGIANLWVYDAVYGDADPNIYLIAAKGGVGRTTDGGATWDWVDIADFIFSVAIHGTTAYSGAASLSYSSDSGATFTPVMPSFDTVLPGGQIRHIQIDPDSGEVYCAATVPSINGGGAFTYSGGQSGSWTPLGLQGTMVNVIRKSGSMLYAGVGNGDATIPGGLYSVDAGAATGSWNKILDLPGNSVWDVAFSGSTIYAAAGHAGSATSPSASSSVFISTDGGGSWTESSLSASIGGPVPAVLIDPVTPTTIYASQQNTIWRNLDSGAADAWHALLQDKSAITINALFSRTSSGATSKMARATSTLYSGSSSGCYKYGGVKAIANLSVNKSGSYQPGETIKIYYDVQPPGESQYNVPVHIYLAVRLANGQYLFYSRKGLGANASPYAGLAAITQISGMLAELPASNVAKGTYILCAMLYPAGQPLVGTLDQIKAKAASLFEEREVIIQ